jgi:hypothetical protein
MYFDRIKKLNKCLNRLLRDRWYPAQDAGCWRWVRLCRTNLLGLFLKYLGFRKINNNGRINRLAYQTSAAQISMERRRCTLLQRMLTGNHDRKHNRRWSATVNEKSHLPKVVDALTQIPSVQNWRDIQRTENRMQSRLQLYVK